MMSKIPATQPRRKGSRSFIAGMPTAEVWREEFVRPIACVLR